MKRRRVIAYPNADGTATVEAQNLTVDRAAATSAHLTRLARAARRAGDPRSMDQLRADLFAALTDGSTTGLDEAAIIEHLRATEDDEPTPPAPEARGAAITARGRISTLAKADKLPGEVAGMGPVHAEHLRDLINRMGVAQWRYALCDDEGRLLHTGLVTARPKGVSRRAGDLGIVELQVRLCDLEILAIVADGARWVPVLDQIAKKHRDWLAENKPSDDPRRRGPAAALRRLLQARDQSCFFMACRAPATTAQIDHTVRWTDHGPTLEPNLGAGCVHDHQLKDQGGWKVTQPEPGRFEWTSRLGHHYQRERRQIIEPVPEPIARPMPAEYPIPHTDTDPAQMLADELRKRPPPEPPPDPPPAPKDDPPPF